MQLFFCCDRSFYLQWDPTTSEVTAKMKKNDRRCTCAGSFEAVHVKVWKPYYRWENEVQRLEPTDWGHSSSGSPAPRWRSCYFWSSTCVSDWVKKFPHVKIRSIFSNICRLLDFVGWNVPGTTIVFSSEKNLRCRRSCVRNVFLLPPGSFALGSCWEQENPQLPSGQRKTQKTHFPSLKRPERSTWVETEREKMFKYY